MGDESKALDFLSGVSDQVAEFFKPKDDDSLSAEEKQGQLTSKKVLKGFLNSSEDDPWSLEFVSAVTDKLQNEIAKNDFQEHAQNILDGDEDITNHKPFAMSYYQKNIVIRCQRSFGLKQPDEGTVDHKLQYVTKLMNGAIMIATLTNTSLMGLLLPVKKGWVQLQHDNLSKNNYKLPKLSCQGSSSLIATTMSYAEEQYNNFDYMCKGAALKGIQYQGDGASASVKRLLKHEEYHLSKQQLIDFCANKGPRALTMILVNHFVQNWIMEPELSRESSYLKTYEDLMEEGPKNASQMSDKIEQLCHDKHVSDLEKLLVKLAEDNTKTERHPFDPSKNIEVIQDAEASNFHDALKAYINMTEKVYGIKYTVKEHGPDPLPALQGFLKSEEAPEELKTELAGLLKMSPFPTDKWLKYESNNQLKRCAGNKQGALSLEERRQLNEKRKFTAKERARENKRKKEENTRKQAILSRQEKNLSKQKALALLKEAGYKQKFDVLLWDEYLQQKTAEEMPPVTTSPTADSDLFKDCDFDLKEIDLKSYYLCDDDGNVTFKNPGESFISKMESLYIAILWATDVSSIKAAQNSEKYKEYLQGMDSQEKKERISHVWAAVYAFLDKDFKVDTIDPEDWLKYSDQSKSTFVNAYHLENIDAAWLCFSYYTIGVNYYYDCDSQEDNDEQDRLRRELIEAVTAGLGKDRKDLSIALAAKLIRIHYFTSGASGTWEEALDKSIRAGNNPDVLQELVSACTDLEAHVQLLGQQ